MDISFIMDFSNVFGVYIAGVCGVIILIFYIRLFNYQLSDYNPIFNQVCTLSLVIMLSCITGLAVYLLLPFFILLVIFLTPVFMLSLAAVLIINWFRGERWATILKWATSRLSLKD